MVETRLRRIARRPVVAWLLGGALLGCGPTAPPPPPPPRDDVVLITVDTARADRFSYVAASSPGTPTIDRLAREGAGFTGAISPVPLTLPAHASLFTGRLPPSHTMRDNGAYRLPASERTLAEVLAAAGYATGAFVGAAVLDARHGLDRGFATYDDEIAEGVPSAFLFYAERSGDQVVDAALRWLDAQDARPLFAWVHLFDPHAPYRPPEPERSRHASPYDGEIAYCDRVVGRLLEGWGARRDLARTIVIATSDHGEALGEHDERTHGVLVHDATLRVPLVVRAPGLRAGRPIDAPVSLIDVMPTLLGLLDLPAPEGVEGRDLGPLLRGEPAGLAWSSRSGYAESLYAQLHHGCSGLEALREDGFKLVRGRAIELYDLAEDPGELRDLAATEPGRRDSMAERLDGLLAALGGREPERVALDDEARRALAALGYLASGPALGGTGARCDPRDALRSLARMAEADRRALASDLEGAIAGYREVLAVEPSSVDARVRLAELLISAGRGSEAADRLAEAVAIAPHEPFLHRKLGTTLVALGRIDEALAAFDAGLAAHPGDRDLRNGRFDCLNRLGRRDRVIAEAERAIADDPTDGAARYARAVACCGQGPIGDYVTALERELAELPGDRLLLRALEQARAEAAGRAR